MARVGRKRGLVVVIVLGSLLALFVVVDRVGSFVASRTLASVVRTQAQDRGIGIGRQPGVTIGGFPFLTQAASGRYDRIDIHLAQVVAHAVELDELDLTATGVSAAPSTVLRRQGTVTAQDLLAHASMSWSSLSTYLSATASNSGVSNMQVSGRSDGQVEISGSIELAGRRTPVRATATLEPAGTAVVLRFGHLIEPTGALSSLAALVARALVVRIPVPGLAGSLAISDIQVRPDALILIAKAHNVVLFGQGSVLGGVG